MASGCVRHMEPGDIDALLKVVRDTYTLHNGIGKNDGNCDDESVKVSLRKMYIDPSFHNLVYDEDDYILGFMITREVETPLNYNCKYGIDIGWGVEEDLTKNRRGRILIDLFREMKKSLKSNGIDRLIVGTPPDNSLQYYIERNGGKLVETKHLVEL